MSGHSKWHSIKHKKGAIDAKRGKMFTQIAKLITIAVQKSGGDPSVNPALRQAIDKAKEINMPNANIERAIKKGSGELKEGALFEEVIYEGYGPEGIALLIQVVTDNKNRALSSVKTILGKNGGNMGAAGCTAWMFEQKGVIEIEAGDKNAEEIELSAIDAGADDVKADGKMVCVYVLPQNFPRVKKVLEDAKYSFSSAEISLVPKTEVAIGNEHVARRILQLMEALEDCDDVTNVASNFDIAAEILEKIGE